MNNKHFANMKEFQFACKLANVAPTKRQASKFRRGHGQAFQALNSDVYSERDALTIVAGMIDGK